MDLRLEENKRTSSFMQYVFLTTIIIIYAFSNIKILSVMSQFVFVGLMFLRIIKNHKVRLTNHFHWMVIFITWGLFISIFAIESALSIITITNFLFKFLFYTSFIMYVDTEYKLNKTLQYIIIAALVLIFRLLLVTPASAWGTERLGEPIDLNANVIGLILGYASIISIYLGKRFKNKLYYLLLLPFIIITLFTGSRKSFLLIILGVSSILILETKRKRNLIFNLLLLFSLSLGLYYLVMNIPLLYNVIGQRLEGLGLFSGEMNASTNTRVTMIEEGLTFLKKRPLIGYGLENFRLLSVYGTYSHNNYIEIAVSTGIIGLLIYYSLPTFIFFSSLRKIKRNKKYSIITVLIGMVLIMDFGLVSYSQLITQIIISICVSYYLILTKSNNIIATS